MAHSRFNGGGSGACENDSVLLDRDETRNRSAKVQEDEIPRPENLGPQVIVSPDTRREQRIPPGQSRTKKWPVLDASGTPSVDPLKWRLRMEGLVRNSVEWSFEQFQTLPRQQVFADFHCVTRWSRLGNLWEGVSTRSLVEAAGGVLPEAKFVLAYGYDYGWTTNLPLEDFLADDALVAFSHDGEPISAEHGGPVRLIVPRLYAWKSAKWLSSVEFLAADRPGFWERNGYHMHGDPWTEERYDG
ncbi:MAG: sulfite oxidase-like oxidoreductase [Bryobacteraceae bacterium]|nr:sulfite oxidase-like oxidoreductase [Bryobacteraceae bacterium]